MTASASSQSRSLTARRSISHSRRAARGWTSAAAAVRWTIACAKRNPQGKMVGIDRWGKEYASFTLPLCEKNAAAEGVKNASFRCGNAVKLDFPDESFDAVTSNYVYHNITGADKQALLLETLRVLKKGRNVLPSTTLMSPGRYGDMQAFVQKLRDMGYERVELMGHDRRQLHDTEGGQTPDASRLNIAGGKKVKRQRHQRKLISAQFDSYRRSMAGMHRPQDCRANIWTPTMKGYHFGGWAAFLEPVNKSREEK